MKRSPGSAYNAAVIPTDNRNSHRTTRCSCNATSSIGGERSVVIAKTYAQPLLVRLLAFHATARKVEHGLQAWRQVHELMGGMNRGPSRGGVARGAARDRER